MKKLGYFGKSYTRTALFNETADLPAVSFVYKPITIFETASLVTAVLDTKTIERSTEENLKMVAAHLVSWDLLKPNPKFNPMIENTGEQEFIVVACNDVEELKLISPILMNFVTNVIRGDSANPLMDKASLEAQIKN